MAQSEKPAVHPWMILSVTSIGAFIFTLNSSTLNVALPTLMQELHASVTDVGWIIMCYMVTVTIFVIHAGKFSDLYGRKKIYITGVVILVMSSLLVGFCNSIYLIIVLRIIQGIGSAMMAANTSAIVMDAFPAAKRGTALGINSMAFSVGAVMGPVVGGLLLHINWRWIFWFNVPIGLFLILWASRTLSNYRPKFQVKPFDVSGTLTLLIGLLGFLGVLTYGLDGGWHVGWIIGLILVSIAILVLFLWIERKAVDPIVHLQVFQNRIYTIANLTSFLNALSRMSVTFIMIFYLQGVRGFSPLAAGMMMIPMGATMSVMSPLSGRISDRIGSRLPTTIGLLLCTIGLFALARLDTDTSTLYIGAVLALIGTGTGMFQSPNMLSIMSSVPATQRGVASGTRMMLNNFGMLLSMSITTGLLGKTVSEKEISGHIISAENITAFLGSIHMIFIGCALTSIVALLLSLPADPTIQKKIDISDQI